MAKDDKESKENSEHKNNEKETMDSALNQQYKPGAPRAAPMQQIPD